MPQSSPFSYPGYPDSYLDHRVPKKRKVVDDYDGDSWHDAEDQNIRIHPTSHQFLTGTHIKHEPTLPG